MRKEESAKPWREKEQEVAARRKEAEEQLGLCRERLETAAAYEALAAKKQHYTELCGQVESLRIKKESMEGLFRAGVPDLSELKRCRQAAEDAAELTGELRSYRLAPEDAAELDVLQRKFATGVPERETIQESIRTEGETKETLFRTEQMYRQVKEKADHEKKKKKLCFGLSVLFMLLAVVLGILAFAGPKHGAEDVPGLEHTEIRLPETAQKQKEPKANVALIGLCGASVLAFAVLLVTGVRRKKEEQTAETLLDEYSTEIEQLRGQRAQNGMLLAQYGVETETDVQGALYRLAEDAGRYETLAQRKERQEQCLQRRDALLRECTDLLVMYGMETEDPAGSLHILETRTRDFIRISEEFAEAAKKREQFEQETSPETFYGLAAPEIGFRELQAEEQELLVRISRATEEEKDCRERAETFEEEAEEATETEELCKELQGALETKKREHFFVTETLKCLQTAKEQFSSRYLRGLTEGFEKYISLLG